MRHTDRMPRVEWPLRKGDYDVVCANGHKSTVTVESSDAYLAATTGTPSTSEKVYRRCPVCGIKAPFVRRAVP